MGFELLVHTLDILLSVHSHVVVYSDNTRVTEGWWNRRHRNINTNQIFCHIHEFLLNAVSIQEVRT